MHIAFAVLFFVFIGLSETLRHGIFGLTASEVTGISTGALVLAAVFILRSDIVNLPRRSADNLYGDQKFNWSWGRTILGLILAPLLWAMPIVYGMTMIQINILPLDTQTLIEALIVQVLLVAVAQELFFREAAIKAFNSDVRAIYLISGLSFFIFYVPFGVPGAIIAAGSGIFYLTLRLIGTNILVVALIHGTTSVVFTNVLSLGLKGRNTGDEWTYAGFFLAGSVILSAAVYQIFAPKRSKFAYA
ncbi:MAG: CPBP family glutamic-type intramembrane protease [Rhodobacteraceae bacterium]|nr:CPBP family glutamic-type intramembrane protease [Paracoccaceae bacterium]